jgi:uroporphyrin-III C-methyltransferase / precorrin-2 dehydrogenase / sirohydrochlorin ferrochelatase
MPAAGHTAPVADRVTRGRREYQMFPVSLDLQGRRCLVVGAGAIALRKVLSLLDAGARVTVVAPDAVEELSALATQGRLLLERRPYEPGEAGFGYAIVFAATDQREVNRRVSDDAATAGVFVNVADDPELCSFHLPARVRRGVLEVTVASGGGAPFLARGLRQLFEERLGPEWAEWAEAACSFRADVRARGWSGPEQAACFERFLSETLDRARIAVRVPSRPELQEWLDGTAAPEAVEPRAGTQPPPPKTGFVSLVGAGPGCAGLLTLRGRERLQSADAVVYDRLAAGAMPTDLPAGVELHGVGKEAGHHPVPQEQINELIVRLALEGKRVVRFKGGDPYVFGRGGEEAEALVEAGVPFEVVPGVTAGIAATAFAGIPVTHRRDAVQVTLLTAHECAKEEGPQLRWDLIAQQTDSTLVGYMGVSALRGVVERLLAAGMDPNTPAAMVEQGTTSEQRSVFATLEALPPAVSDAGLRPPAVFVIGPSIRHAERLNWTSRRPLAGERLAVPADASNLTVELESAGAEVVPVPLPITPAARVVLNARPITGCFVRSPADVEAFDEESSGPGWDRGWTGWCLCSGAAERAIERGWRRVESLEGVAETELVERLARRRRRGVA